MARKVISFTNLPMRMPLWPSMVLWLFLDHYKAPGWAWGVVGTLMALVWIVWACNLWIVERVELRELAPKEKQ